MRVATGRFLRGELARRGSTRAGADLVRGAVAPAGSDGVVLVGTTRRHMCTFHRGGRGTPAPRKSAPPHKNLRRGGGGIRARLRRHETQLGQPPRR